ASMRRRLSACVILALTAGAASAHAQGGVVPSASEAARAAAGATAPTRDEPEETRRVVPRLPGPDYLRAGLEELAMLAGGTIWYLIDERNVLDWDFDSVEQRFREEAYRFDNNHFPINFVAHP